jgi:glycosyltransferase involved in cell wall biosynthesis
MAYGGVETVLINWLRKLNRTRFDVHVACFANPGQTETPFVEAAERAGLQVTKIPWGRHKPVWKAAHAVAEFIRERDIEILHTHNSYANFVGLLAARMAPVKTITTLYVWADFNWKRNVLQALDRWAIRWFDRITAHCEFTRLETLARGLPPERVTTLPCGFEGRKLELSPQERWQLRRQRGIADDQVLLLNAARFYPEKAHDSLLRCFRQIHARAPHARLWIAGVGPLENRIKAYCTELGLDSVVTFLGFEPDLVRILSLADIQVHPAVVEGVPLSLCEGMAQGLPIVASAVGGIPEILDHGRSGVLVPFGEEGAFADAVCHLIEHPEERATLSQAARHFIETEYSLDAAVQRVERSYFEMLGTCASASSS